jgi:hypothetical protein
MKKQLLLAISNALTGMLSAVAPHESTAAAPSFNVAGEPQFKPNNKGKRGKFKKYSRQCK